jgi:DNA-binding FadR family transcriptional regulator
MALQAQRHSNLSHRVALELGRAIVSGNIKPGNPVPTEADLSKKFGVSRTAVREAVKMLSAKGLIASKPRQGIRVLPEESWNIFDPDLLQWSLESGLTREVLLEFFEMRRAIEPEAAALAAIHASDERLQSVAAALEAMRAAMGDPDSARDADVGFHIAILYATGNRYYVRMRDFIRTALDVSIRFTTGPEADFDHVLVSHETVYRAIAKRQPERAHRAMRQLIDDALVLIEANQPQNPSATGPGGT